VCPQSLDFILSFDDDLKSLPPLQEVSFDANLVESDGVADLMNIHNKSCFFLFVCLS
jgi:hypothetical protein